MTGTGWWQEEGPKVDTPNDKGVGSRGGEMDRKHTNGSKLMG